MTYAVPDGGPTDDGIPAHLSLAQTARVLGFAERVIRNWADRGTLQCQQLERYGKRFVSRTEIQAVADRMGIKPNWSVTLD